MCKMDVGGQYRMKADENIAGGFELEDGFSDRLACNFK